MSKKPNFFTVKELDQIAKDADYVLLAGARNNGKSYAVKSRCIQDAYNNIKDGFCKRQMGYIRRFSLDCKDSKCEPYFADMPVQALTNNEYTHISVFRKDIYFSKYEDEKIVRKVKIGHCFSVAGAEHEKSLMYPDIANLIYEEVVSESSNYLYREPWSLMNLISTIIRSRSDAKVYLIGNLLSRDCIYDDEWNLNIDSLDFGESNVIKFNNEDESETVLVVYKTRPIDYAGSKMFFGHARKNIVKGEYITDIYPIINKNIRHYKVIYKMVMEYNKLKYLMYFFYNKEYKTHMWYIEPLTTDIKPDARLITNQQKTGKKITNKFTPLSEGERKIFSYLYDKTKVCFSDNLTGTEFYNFIDKFK